MQLYDGRGRGTLTLDGSSQMPVTGANLTLEGISAQPLLKDALGFDWLEGRSTIALALAGQGVSERQMVETLNGKVDMATINGAIVGVDVGKVLRNIERGRLDLQHLARARRRLSASSPARYTIANGVAQNQDLRLVSPRVFASPARAPSTSPSAQLDYTVRPEDRRRVTIGARVVNLTDVEIPVRIEGAWDKPDFTDQGPGADHRGDEADRQEHQVAGRRGRAQGSARQGRRPAAVKPRDLLEKFLKKQ